MGYRTYHSMDVINVAEDYKLAIIADLRKTCEAAKYSLDEDGYPIDETTWYDCDKHLREFSKEYPDIVIMIHGAGEECGDIWNRYFSNGKMQSCDATVTIPPFNPDLLE